MPNYDEMYRGKRDTTVHEIFHIVSRFRRNISCSIAENRVPLGQCRRASHEFTTSQLCGLYNWVAGDLTNIMGQPHETDRKRR